MIIFFKVSYQCRNDFQIHLRLPVYFLLALENIFINFVNEKLTYICLKRMTTIPAPESRVLASSLETKGKS